MSELEDALWGACYKRSKKVDQSGLKMQADI